MSILVRTISDQAYEVMRERILNGAMPGGSPVRQDTVADELGVSKIPLREALTRLEQDGLVISFPNRGFIVRSMSADEAEEVFELRLKLEPDAMARACLKVDKADQEAAKAAFDDMERDTAPGGLQNVVLNRKFHMALVSPGVGLVTKQFVERLNILAERYVRMHLEPVGRDNRAHVEHQRLLDAWLNRQPDTVAELSKAHITGILEDIRHQLALALSKAG
jgi:DNA-binding GntR family transcriptional regulator